MTYRDDLIPRIAPVLHANITTEAPYHDVHLFLEGDGDHDPWAAHPAFGNSFDWHSSVHSHRTALLLLEDATPSVRDALLTALRTNLQPERIAREREYMMSRPAYERPYGWAWALSLAQAAQRSADERIRASAAALHALASHIADTTIAWLEVLPIPVRHGVHSNTAFALGLMHDACAALEFDTLQATIEERARTWFFNDCNYDDRFERSGNDFLSGGLCEAALMKRVLDRSEFERWWNAFLPNLADDAAILTPARVPNVSDGHIVHLHGLNLSRAAVLATIAQQLRDSRLLTHAKALYDASVTESYGEEYLSTHWLATFAYDAACALDSAIAAT